VLIEADATTASGPTPVDAASTPPASEATPATVAIVATLAPPLPCAASADDTPPPELVEKRKSGRKRHQCNAARDWLAQHYPQMAGRRPTLP
jgi:hypothetical protein